MEKNHKITFSLSFRTNFEHPIKLSGVFFELYKAKSYKHVGVSVYKDFLDSSGTSSFSLEGKSNDYFYVKLRTYTENNMVFKKVFYQFMSLTPNIY